MPILTLDGISKSYGANVVLEDLNLDVEKQELMVVLGPSGVGKSTLLYIVAGLLKQDSGNIYINGEIFNGVPPEKRSVKLVFQEYLLFPHLNVFENVAFSLKIKKYSAHEIRRKTNEVLQLLEIENIKDRHPEALSAGQQQRVALARALVAEPEIILLDEPMSNLDANLRKYLRFELRHILKSKLQMTTVMVTHDQADALSMADRIAILHDRNIEHVGNPREIFLRPKTEFVASFVGFENIYKGHVTATSPETGTVKVAIGSFEIVAPFEREFLNGDRVLVSIRPEDIAITTVRRNRNAQNVVRGRIEELLSSGLSTRLKVATREALEFVVVAPPYAVSEFGLKIGKEVYLVFKPSSVNLIKRAYCECEGGGK